MLYYVRRRTCRCSVEARYLDGRAYGYLDIDDAVTYVPDTDVDQLKFTLDDLERNGR